MTLSFDTQRCSGTEDQLCKDCQRLTKELFPEEYRQATIRGLWWVTPEAKDGKCNNFIPPKKERE